MSHGEVEQRSHDIEERPKKKRRFFVDDPDDVDEAALNPEPSLPDEIAPAQTTDNVTNGSAVGFDAESLEAIIGEKLSLGDVRKLETLSNGNIEQGGIILPHARLTYSQLQRSTCISTDHGRRPRHRHLLNRH